MPDYLEYRFFFNDDRESGIMQYYMRQDQHAVIPHIVAGFPLTAIGRYAFAYTEYDTYVEPVTESITLEEGYKELYHQAFFDCPKLMKLVLPSTLETIYGNPFDGAPNLAEIEFPNGNDHFVFKNGKLTSKDGKTVYFERKAAAK